MNIWFTSDLHFSHKNIAGAKVSQWNSGFRTFDSIDQMNDTLFNTLNKYVKKGDILYFLGDFCFGGHDKTPLYRSKINCDTIHFIRGNHDEHIDLYKDSFTSINDVMTLKYAKKTIFLSHYAHRAWNGSHKGVVHLYGHNHGTLEDYGLSMDVGVDVAYRMFGEYRPFNINEIIDIMNNKNIER